MHRSYQNIKQYEREIFELKAKGITLREIGTMYGFTYEQAHNFIIRYNNRGHAVKARNINFSELKMISKSSV